MILHHIVWKYCVGEEGIEQNYKTQRSLHGTLAWCAVSQTECRTVCTRSTPVSIPIGLLIAVTKWHAQRASEAPDGLEGEQGQRAAC